MGKIYKNQTKVELEVTVNQNITGATTKEIKYKKPSGATGEWPAESIDDSLGVLEKLIFLATDWDETGDWTLWGHVVFSDGREAPGEPFIRTIHPRGC